MKVFQSTRSQELSTRAPPKTKIDEQTLLKRLQVLYYLKLGACAFRLFIYYFYFLVQLDFYVHIDVFTNVLAGTMMTNESEPLVSVMWGEGGQSHVV